MKKLCMLLFMILPATAWAADWSLDGANSDINVVSVKKGTVAEVHHFTRLSGSVSDRKATVKVALASVESGIGIRNERMKSMLFDVASFATATISADISHVDTGSLKTGEAVTAIVPFTLDLHGFKKELKANVTIVSLQDGLLVTSRSPVIVKAADFGLTDGIEALRAIAKLPSISQSVPVSFQLNFKH
ncbi:YceI-like domain protein [Mariprofundus micogutta]|uniref:YceI-like domain protein n=1 Tax=Mariprofundus micogutta TaxID=1921010 RepID=A0A1L8CR43_9PROT|nr:YceI family protein [Mariprofundus micogutta]GAV21373.1 YceI-like domain protein [Mariprofundus micogutta]